MEGMVVITGGSAVAFDSWRNSLNLYMTFNSVPPVQGHLDVNKLII